MSNELVKAGVTGTLAVRTMDDLARLGNMLAQSGYFTDAREAAQAGVKVLAGLEMGIGAFSAMSGIHIIEGKPSVGAGLMAAAVKRHAKYDYRVLKHTAKECEIAFYENGEQVGVSTYTIEDAKQANVAFKSRSGNPTAWTKNPRNMLFARALSNGVRWYAPDVFDVSTYTPEELGAETDDDGNVITVQATTRPQPVKAETNLEVAADVAEEALEEMVDEVGADSEFPPEPEQPAADEAPPRKPGLSAEKASGLHAALGKVGLKKLDHPAFASAAVKREIASFKELTTRDAKIVYDTAQQVADGVLEWRDGKLVSPPDEIDEFPPEPDSPLFDEAEA